MFTALAQGFGDMQDKLNLFVAFAPITRLFGSKSPFLHSLADKIPLVRNLLNFLNIYEFFGPSWNAISKDFCIVLQDLCDQVSVQSVPYNDFNNEYYGRVINRRQQSSTSVKEILHYAEIIASDIFEQFDYGDRKENVAHYGPDFADAPPVIHLSKIGDKVPISMFVGKEDILSTPIDAQWARDEIGRAVFHYRELENHDHSSFNFGKDMSFMEDVVAMVQKYNPLDEINGSFLNN